MYSGRNTDFRTPLYSGEGREEIVKRLEEAVGYTEFEELTEIDKHEKDKIGPYSIQLPSDERLENLDKYWHQEWNPDEASLDSAVNHVLSLLPIGSLRPAKLSEAYSQMPTDTSLGLPWVTRDRKYANDYLRRAESFRSSDDVFPAIWYWRGQPRGMHETPKQRDVWGMDHLDTIIGATILYPLLSALRERPGFAAWLGNSYVDEESTRLIRKANGRSIISSDYSGFDTSVSRSLQLKVDEVWCKWFVEPASSLILSLGEICATVPIVVPYKVLSGRNGGIASGHILTNMKDTMANLIAGWYAAIRLGTELEDYMVLGDDSVFLFRDEVDASSLSTVMKDLGLDMNPDKQFISETSIHYLQRWHSSLYEVNGVFPGVHSPYRSCSGWTGYERFRPPAQWSKYMDTARWIMQTENCCNHPFFPKIVKFIYDGDKVLQSGMDPTIVFKRAGGSEAVRQVLNIASFPFNVKDPDKVDIFRTTLEIRKIQDSRR
jgi:hypothetical protein